MSDSINILCLSSDSAEHRDLRYGTCVKSQDMNEPDAKCKEAIEQYCKTHEELDMGWFGDIDKKTNTIKIAGWDSTDVP